MEINKIQDGAKLTMAISGCLDTTTSPELQAVLDDSPSGVTELNFDFASLDYISSAGLRVLLVANKKMASVGGKMTIQNVNPSVKEVLEMTGFLDIFTLI